MTSTVQIRSAPGSLLVLLTASAGCAMPVLDTNVVGVVLPTISRDLGASFADVEWVISSYVLCFASLLLPAGAIADRFGRRTVFLGGVILFAIASVLCGLAGSAFWLCMARAIQGIGAAFLLAPALAIIGHTFHDEVGRNRAWAIWGGVMGMTMALSPVIGGLVADVFGWRWAFFVNAPLCVLLASAVVFLVADSRDRTAGALDPAGIGLFAMTMFGLTAGLINGQEHGWGSVGSLTGFSIGLFAAAAFVAVENAQRRPMLDLSLFLSPRFIGAVLAMFAYAACAQVMTSLLPQFLQNGLGRTPIQAGFSMLPFALAMLVFPYVGRRLGRRLSSRQVLIQGLAIVAAGNSCISWGAHSGSPVLIATGMVVLGAGGGLLNGETQKAIMGETPHERAGMASGISTTARFSGILLGFAMLSGVLSTATKAGLTKALCVVADGCKGSARFADAVAAGDLGQALEGLAGPTRELAAGQAQVAYANGFSAALATAAICAALAAVSVARLMPAHRTGVRPS